MLEDKYALKKKTYTYKSWGPQRAASFKTTSTNLSKPKKIIYGPYTVSLRVNPSKRP